MSTYEEKLKKIAKVKLVYIAGPYMGKSREEIELNIKSAQQNAKYAVLKGWMPVIPHKNTELFEILTPDVSIDFWYNGTLKLLDKCDAILMCPGWEFSTGANSEHYFAVDKGLDIFYSTEEIPDLTGKI